MDDELNELFPNFDTDLFDKPVPTPEDWLRQAVENPSSYLAGIGMCPYYPKACDWAETSRCAKWCQHNPDNFMDPKIKAVFDKEPWSNYCFTCGEFVPTRNHENALETPQVVYSHTVATGYNEYRLKLAKWVLERLTGNEPQ